MKKFKIFIHHYVNKTVSYQYESGYGQTLTGEEEICASRLEWCENVTAASEDEAMEKFKASKYYSEKEEYLIMRVF